jgi:hypothetical protein
MFDNLIPHVAVTELADQIQSALQSLSGEK